MPTRFRLKFDVPYNFTVEPGYYRSAHCHDIRLTEKELSNTYQDPLTGLLTLKPSHLTNDYYNVTNWVQLSQLQHEATYWQAIYRNYDLDDPDSVARFWSTYDSGSGVIDNLAAVVRAQVLLSSALVKDYLVWAAQTDFSLSADEGFVWHYRAFADEHGRPRNWFALAWGGIYLHFSTDGVCRAYVYPTSGGAIDWEEDPLFYDSFVFGSPGEILQRDGWFSFQPIPRYGLAIYHSNTPQTLPTRSSSASAGAARGHLLKLPLWEDDRVTGTGDVLLPSSPLSFAINRSLLRIQHVFGMHRITYPTSGTFADNVFDPGYFPSVSPAGAASTVPTKPLRAGVVTAASSVRNTGDTAVWTAGTDRQGRFRGTLGTSNNKYTPFVLAGNIQFAPVFSERTTTPVTIAHHGNANLPDRVFDLEFADDENGRFEGQATIYATSDAMRKIVERGDTTFELEISEDEGETWDVHAGGLARVEGDWEAQIYGTAEEQQMNYLAKFSLADMFVRFRETSVLWETAFDGLSIAQSIRNVMRASGVSATLTIPAELENLYLPSIPQGQNWRFAPRPNDHGDEVVRNLLLLAKKQFIEYRMRHVWESDEWIVEAKPKGLLETDLWTLTPFDDEIVTGGGASVATRQVRVGRGTRSPFSCASSPPEANLVRPFGMTDTNNNQAEKIPCVPISNRASLIDNTSRDYLGRVICAAPMFASITDENEIYRMGRRVYDAISHHRLKPRSVGDRFVAALTPLKRATLRGLDATGARADIFTGLWLKRRFVKVDYQEAGEDAPTVAYYMDSVWDGDIK